MYTAEQKNGIANYPVTEEEKTALEQHPATKYKYNFKEIDAAVVAGMIKPDLKGAETKEPIESKKYKEQKEKS